MFRFEYPQYLYLLALVPVFILLYILNHYRKRRSLRAYGDPQLLSGLMRDVSTWHPAVKFALLMVALSSLVIAFARPQRGTRINTEERSGIEAMIAVDVSNSMLAEDVRPSRLEKAKMLFSNMVDNMKDDHVGIVVFAGEAYTKLPITNDYVSAKMVLDQMEPSMIDVQGTDVAAAIKLAQKNFSSREDVARAIFLLTDGEDNEGEAIEAARNAAAQGTRVYVLGVGSARGAHIPMPGTHQYMVDEEGRPVVTKLNEEMCAEIAKAGEGAYIYVENSTSAQNKLNKYLEKLQKTNLEKNVYSEYDEQFQGFLIIALVCLLLEVLLPECRTHLFSRRKTASMILFLLLSATASAQNYRDYLRRGNRLYEKGLYDQALVEYKNAYQMDSTNLAVLYNHANTLLRLGEAKSDSLLVRAAEYANTPERRAKIYNNRGWLYQSIYTEEKRTGKKIAEKLSNVELLQYAVANYREALRNTPDDDEIRYNYALSLYLLKKELPKGENGGSSQQQNNQQGADDKQDKDDKKEDKNKPDESEQNKDKKEEPQDKDKQNAEQLLNDALKSERRTQQKVQDRKYGQSDKGERRLKKQW